MDLIHTHWTLTIQPWTVLYSSKGGPNLNIFLCYLRSPGHNGKTRTSLFGGVSSFPWLFTHTHVPPFRYLQTLTHTPIHTEGICHRKRFAISPYCFSSQGDRNQIWPWQNLSALNFLISGAQMAPEICGSFRPLYFSILDNRHDHQTKQTQ